MSIDDGRGEEAFPPQRQEPPGLTTAMDPQPDHGEESYRGTQRLSGIRALITGGDSGIGRAIAIALAREGADLALSYLPAEQLDAEAGRQVVLLPGDLTDEDTCRSVADSAIGQLGAVDVLINNFTVNLAVGTWAPWYPGQRGRTGTDLDTASAGHATDGEGPVLRVGHPARSSRTTVRDSTGVRLPRQSCRGQLRERHSSGRHRRKAGFLG